MKSMDMFDILEAIKIEFMCKGMNENNARRKAESTVSDEFHISLHDIEKHYSQRNGSWI
jgi:hypothetical protein